jgi:dTDP-L-rhamnose 4-epimerase
MRDYVYVGDVASANAIALEDPRTHFEAYNVGGPSPISALEYAHAVSDVVQPGLEPEVPGLYRFGDTRHAVSDSTKLKALGWRNTRSLTEVITEYAAWIEEAGLKHASTDIGMQKMRALGVVRQRDSSRLS